MDIFNPFIIEMSVEHPSRVVIPGDGNETPEDLSGYPVVVVARTSQIQVYIMHAYIPLLILLYYFRLNYLRSVVVENVSLI